MRVTDDATTVSHQLDVNVLSTTHGHFRTNTPTKIGSAEVNITWYANKYEVDKMIQGHRLMCDQFLCFGHNHTHTQITCGEPKSWVIKIDQLETA